MKDSRQRFFSLQQWPGDVAERRAYVDPIFTDIARRYDLMARLFSLGMVHGWKKKSVALIGRSHPKRILDLASGTGDFPIHLRRAGFEAPIIGLDRNLPMLAVAREKCSSLSGVVFIPADLMHIPIKDRSFDVVTMGYGLRYPADIRSVLGEIFRLLDSGGVFVAMDFGLPKNLLYRKICFGYLLGLGTLVGLLLHRKADTYWHIVESLKVYPGQKAVRQWLAEAGFVEVEMRELFGGIIVIHRGIRP
ncbi:MAG TPA: class I SAM-dependent methyltransferase [Candidatus Binatia bacterium]|jgi:demethylmenaquinone methyltransferase/2-methoxy-6-polyprenyl-1,4-benzoquinol methylase